MRRLLSIAFVLALIAAACGGDDDSAVEDDASGAGDEAAATDDGPAEDDAPTTTQAPTTTTTEAATSTTTTTTEPPPPWREVVADDCVCSDGSEYRYWVRDADPDKVMLFYAGGGACFDAASCDPNREDPVFTPQASPDPNEFDTGVFQLDNPANPVADWTMIFMPYCTGDVHVGTNVAFDHGDGVVINHTGFFNGSKGIDEIATNYGGASQIFVTGSSAGGIAAPLYAGLAAEAMPDAEVLSVADAGGGYPSVPLLNSGIGLLWGTEGAIPDWPSTEGATAADFGIPNMFVFADQAFPRIRWARFDHAFDAVQTGFSALAGVEDPSVRNVLDINEALVEDAGIDLPVYIAPGDDHTILRTDDVYTLEVGGVAFIDWLTDFINGEPIEDVVCEDCGAPA